MNLSELQEALFARQECEVIPLVVPPTFQVIDRSITMEYQGRSYQVPSIEMLCSYLPFLPTYAEVCLDHPGIMKANLDYWYAQFKPEQLAIWVDNDTILAISRNERTKVVERPGIQEFWEYLHSYKQLDQCQFELETNREGIFIKCLTPQQVEPRPGDVVQGGIQLVFKDRGKKDILQTDVLLLRKECNSEILSPTPHASRSFFPEAVRRTMQGSIKRSFSDIDQYFKQIKEAVQKTVNDPILELQIIIDRMQFSEKFRYGIHKIWQVDPDPTTYGIIKTFSRASKLEGISLTHQQVSKRIAGYILTHQENPHRINRRHCIKWC